MSKTDSEPSWEISPEGAVQAPTKTEPSVETKPLRTPAVELRALIVKGVVKEDALTMVATMFGIRSAEHSSEPLTWTIKQINALLFLKELVSDGKVTDSV